MYNWCMAVVWEWCCRDFQQPWQFHFLTFTAELSLAACLWSLSVLCFLHGLPVFPMGVLEGLFWCLQNYSALDRCVCKNPWISVPSELAHQGFSVPLQRHLCTALFIGAIIFCWSIFYLHSFHLVLYFLINCTSITFRLFLLQHS